MDFVFRSPVEIEDFLSTFHSLGNKNLYDGFAFIRLGIFQCFVENIAKYYLLRLFMSIGFFERRNFTWALDPIQEYCVCSKSFMKFYNKKNAICSHSKRYRSILRQRHKPNKPWLLSTSTRISKINFTATRCPNS